MAAILLAHKKIIWLGRIFGKYDQIMFKYRVHLKYLISIHIQTADAWFPYKKYAKMEPCWWRLLKLVLIQNEWPCVTSSSTVCGFVRRALRERSSSTALHLFLCGDAILHHNSVNSCCIWMFYTSKYIYIFWVIQFQWLHYTKTDCLRIISRNI